MEGSGAPGAGTADRPPLTYGQIAAISLPIILSNVTTPLLGITHTAVVGQLGAPHLIGAVALGATIFTLLFWAFGFLRMGTTGLTAQAEGSGNPDLVAAVLAQALLLAGVAGGLLLILQTPIVLAAMHLLNASAAAEAETQRYFDIRIWSAPFALANYAFLGWFIGLAKTRIALALQLVLNGLNVVLSIALVSWLGWGVAGVALSTVASEIVAAALGAVIALSHLRERGAAIRASGIFDAAGLRRMLAVNGDLMIRTLCLLFVFTFFTAKAAEAGDAVLAANAILLQFLNIASYLLDGFAFATEALTGQAIGAGNRAHFRRAVRLSSVLAILVSVGVSAAFLLAGGVLIDAMATDAATREIARLYLPWAVAAPIAGVACFQLDGIFIGATRSREMRDMMIVSLAVFMAAWALLTPAFGNHGLWASIIVFFIVRAITLGVHYSRLERASFACQSGARLHTRGE
jgi:MATE family multidrug resistance protein